MEPEQDLVFVNLWNMTNATPEMAVPVVPLAVFDQIRFNNDSFFLCSMAVVIFLMQCGFAFLEAGSVRSKNTTNILIKNLLDSCISAIAYWALGWAFAYGQDAGHFIGVSDFFLAGFDETKFPLWFFQFVFAATASTIVSGALAERCEFVAYFAYCALLTGFTYPVITHWGWDSNGWLYRGINGIGYKDFAGSGVVHLHGGTSALVGAFILGPRIGRFAKRGEVQLELKGHSVPFAAMGGFILMFGFFAFNGGSRASISVVGDGKVVARAMTNTMLCGAWATITCLLIHKLLYKQKKWSLLLSINAVLAGMVSACAGCDALEPWACVIVGIGAGLSYLLVSFLVEFAKIDDPVDAVAVHAGGGLWGLLITPFLMNGGVFLGPNRSAAGIRLAMNIIGALAIIVWSGVIMGTLFTILRQLKLFRVSKEVEWKGLDIYKHGEPAYPLSAYGHGWVDQVENLEGAVRRLSIIDVGNPLPAHDDGNGCRPENAEMQAMHRRNAHSAQQQIHPQHP